MICASAGAHDQFKITHTTNGPLHDCPLDRANKRAWPASLTGVSIFCAGPNPAAAGAGVGAARVK